MQPTPYLNRLYSIDWLRGLVMIVMALDHVRNYFTAGTFDPMSDPNTSPSLYITRWVTHLCAPAFVLLAGTSIGLMASRKPRFEISRFLFIRGIWLILLEMTVISFAWEFNVASDPVSIILQVIWALGVSMIAMSALIFLHTKTVLFIGLFIIVASGLLDTMMPASSMPNPDSLWLSIHRQIIWRFNGVGIVILYPILTWVGVMACGYGLSTVFTLSTAERQKYLVRAGIGLLCLFFLLRWLGIYGDPTPWAVADTTTQTIMNFFNVNKYPPSLLYLSITIGINLLLLALVERWRLPLHNALIIIGRVPLFYYIVHLYIIHLAALVVGLFMGLPATAWLVGLVNKPDGFGFDLPIVYLVWALVVLSLYPACKWFAAVKARRKDWWLSYL